MAHTLKVKSAKRDRVIVDGVDFIDVAFEILDGSKVVESKKQGFPSGTPEKEIQEVLKRHLAQFITEKENAILDAERAQAHAADEKTITGLTNLEIDHEVTSQKRTRKG